MSRTIQCPRCDTVLTLGGRDVARGTHVPCPGCGVQLWVEPEPRPVRKPKRIYEEPPSNAGYLPWVIGIALFFTFVFVVSAIIFTVAFIRGNAAVAPLMPAVPGATPTPAAPVSSSAPSRYDQLRDGRSSLEIVELLGRPTDEYDADDLDRYYDGTIRADVSTKLLAWTDERSYVVLALFVNDSLHGKAMAQYGPGPKLTSIHGLPGRDRPPRGPRTSPQDSPDEMLAALRRLGNARRP